MSMTDTVTDSTDWLGTPLASLAPIENSLRCQVCKDFFTTPMITSCSHTFCSLCIRRYLSQEGRCPACRESDQEIKLRRNWIVEELVAQFQTGRENILKYAQSGRGLNEERPAKRRKVESSVEPERRSTRSQSRRNADPNGNHAAVVIEVNDSEDDDGEEGSEYEDDSQKVDNVQPDDGLIACPICNKRMKEAHINRHLDSNCQDRPSSDSPGRSNTPQMRPLAHGQSKPVAREKLPTINYSMFSEPALRKKLKDLGIPNHGSKELMRRRHTEWVNLWNASCDAQSLTSPLQLRKNLDQWERTLGRQIDRGPSGVMVKDFDRDGWQKSNKNDFDDLIRQARERAAAKKMKVSASDPEPSSGSVDELGAEARDGAVDGPLSDVLDTANDRSISVDEQYQGVNQTVRDVSATYPPDTARTNGVQNHDTMNVDDELYRHNEQNRPQDKIA